MRTSEFGEYFLKLNSKWRWSFYASVGLAVMVIAAALYWWGAAEVRANAGELFFLTSIGLAWTLLAARFFPWFGLSFADDVVERRNPGAAVALNAAVVTIAILYAGGSLGEGESYWFNFFSAGIATVGWLLLWILLDAAGKITVSITEDRDLASGLRLGAFLVSIGAVLARAVAGDWHSALATIHDFIHDGWPAGVICVVAIVAELVARPSRKRPVPPWFAFGCGPALLYLAMAGGWVWHLGAWEGMP